MLRNTVLSSTALLFAFAAALQAGTTTYDFLAEIEAAEILPLSGGPAVSPVGVLPDVGSTVMGSVTVEFDESKAGTGDVDAVVITDCSFAGLFCGAAPFPEFGVLEAFDVVSGLVNFNTLDTFDPVLGGTYQTGYNLFGTGGYSLVSGGNYDGVLEYETTLGGDAVTYGVGFSFTSVDLAVSTVPLPMPAAMLGSGLALMGALRLRKARAR